MRIIVAHCSVTYEGRLAARLGPAPRLVLLKADGSIAVHADSLAYKPLNWMNPPCTIRHEEGLLVAETPKGVTCTKCEVTWVKLPSTAGGKQGAVTQYSWSKRDACPDCKDAVSNFFATGKLAHACKTCGDSMKICDTH